MKKYISLIFLLFSIIYVRPALAQSLGTLEIGENINYFSHELTGNRKYFKTNKIYFRFTMYDGINGKIGTDLCKIEVDSVGSENSETPVYSDKYEIDQEWYTTWTSIELPNGRYRLRLYDGDDKLLGKSIIFTVNK